MKARVKVLVCDPIHEDGTEKLRQADLEVDVNPTISGEELKRVVSNYDAIIVRSRTQVTKEIIEAGRGLRIIGRAGAGLDNIDVEAAEKGHIAVLNTPEAPAEAVAELTMGLMISLARSIPLADRTMKEGGWIKRGLMGWELRGKTLGTIGLGNIGERVARIAKALGMRILITKRTEPSPELLRELEAEYIPLKELPSFLQRSDIVTVHVPLTPETRHMIGERELQLMKDGAILINTSRGAIVDERALLEALQSGKLRGAALDVYEVEPPKDLALIKLNNVVCTPHIGAQTEEAQRIAAILIAEKVINSLK
ncbi:MAG: Glyoxylate reductase [Candidatus Bathyarchaeota archaeon BA1]|nr:MAG: Glyoxylate reductase [Candidatus Bathyarchaeota archaeon BA1]